MGVEGGVGVTVAVIEEAEAEESVEGVVGLAGVPVVVHRTILAMKTVLALLLSPETNLRFPRVEITWMLTLPMRRSWHKFTSTCTSIS